MTDGRVNPVEEEPTRRRFPIAVTYVLIAFVGLILSFFWLLRDPANYQEQYTVTLSTQSAHSIYKEASPDDPMPLYYMLTHFMANHHLGGLLNLRFLSLACFLLLPLTAYLITRLITDNRHAGWVAVMLMGLSPFLLWFGDRATVYSMLALITLLNQYFFARLLLRKRGGWAGYIVTSFFGLFIHYFFAMVLLTQMVYWAIKWRSHTTKANLAMIVLWLLLAVSFGLWIHSSIAAHSQFWSQLPYNTVKPSATNIFILLVQYLFGFQSVIVTTLTMALWPLLAILALLAIQKYIRLSEVMQYFALAAVLPIISIFIVSWVWRPLFLVSYLIICAPACLLLVGRYLTAFNLTAIRLGRYVVVAVVAFSLFWEVFHPAYALQGDYLGDVTSTPRVTLTKTVLGKKISLPED